MANGFAAGGQLTTTTDGARARLSIFVPNDFNDLQLKTSPVSLEASSVQSSWKSSVPNPTNLVQGSSQKPSLASISPLVHSDTGVRLRKTKSHTQLTR